MEKMERTKEFIAPAKLLPAELLSEVFKCHVWMGGSPWCLSRVCKAWSTVVFNTPHAWSYISIESGPWRSFETWGSPMQSCNTASKLKVILERAGNTPLTVKFKLGLLSDKTTKTNALVNDALSMLPRVVDLTLDFQPRYPSPTAAEHDAANTMETEIIESIVIPDMPVLHTLKLVQWNHRPLYAKMLNCISRSSLRIDSVTGERSVMTDQTLLDNSDLFGRLTSLNWNSRGRLSGAAACIIESTNLRSLILGGVYMSQLPTTSDPALVFQRVKVAKIMHTGWALSNVTIRSLTCLFLTDVRFDSVPDFSISVPALRQLYIWGRTWISLRAFRCPKLEILELAQGPANKDANSELKALWV